LRLGRIKASAAWYNEIKSASSIKPVRITRLCSLSAFISFTILFFSFSSHFPARMI
jgi:hypothetical protein